MPSLLPWTRRRTTEPGGNGGSLTPAGNFPTLMRRMQTEFDDLFERFTHGASLAGIAPGMGGWRWGLEVEDKDDSLVVRAEAPGFEAGEFDIQVSENRLTLRAAHKREAREQGGEYREERECYDTLTLPSGIDQNNIDACYHNGVLTLTIPKTPAAKAKKISVKAN